MAIHQDMLHVTKYEVLGKLPDHMTFEDGTPFTDASQWERRREELYATAVDLQFGGMPPEPEFVEVEQLNYNAGVATYHVHTGTRACPITFTMTLMVPNGGGSFPVIVDGDMCFPCHFNREFLDAALKEGIGWLFFNRTEIAHDMGTRKGQIYDTYPGAQFSATSAWAWGYSRCVDAMEILFGNRKPPLVDLSRIAFTGHSRGGKTAMLAGAVDRRAAVVNPNETCAGGCGCYRIHMEGYCEGLPANRSETLDDLWRVFAFWLGPDMEQYTKREQDLPFDSHYLKAMVAPRVLFVSEAAGDVWANPVGSWMTTKATESVYDLLGKPENLYWYFREGTHFHNPEDVRMLVNVIKRLKNPETPLSENFFKTPFVPPEPIY